MRKTGLYINPNDWSVKTNLPKTNNETNKAIKSRLEKLAINIYERFNIDNTKGVVISNDWLTNVIDEFFNRVDKLDLSIVTNYVQQYIDNSDTKRNKTGGLGLTNGTIKNYRAFKKILLEYEKESKQVIIFRNIDKVFLDKFTNWLLNKKKYSKNYAGRQLEFIKTISNDAEQNNIKTNVQATKLKSFRLSERERHVITLNFEDLDKIYCSEMPSERLREVKKWILIGCAIGQRGGDLLALTPANIQAKQNAVYIELIQQKTDKGILAPVEDERVINILLNDFPKKVSLNKINKYIKEVCKLSGIDEVTKGYQRNKETGVLELVERPKYEFITSHTFRRSFATNFYKIIDTRVLKEITGHSTERMFLKYINQKEDKELNAELFLKEYAEKKKKEEPTFRILKNG